MRESCIIYCRVSTKQQMINGESLETQARNSLAIAKSRNYKVLPNGGAFKEPYTGDGSLRPIFDGEIMPYIKNNPGIVDHLIIRDIVRFTRGGSYIYEQMKGELAKYGVNLIDSYGIIQPPKNTLEHLDVEFTWSKFSPSEIAELITAEQGKAERRDILTRTIGRQIELVRDGYHVGQATDGFDNETKRINGKKELLRCQILGQSIFLNYSLCVP